MDNNDANSSPATVFFQDSAGCRSSSEEDVKNVGQALADICVDDNDSDFQIGILQAKISRLLGLQTIILLSAYD